MYLLSVVALAITNSVYAVAEATSTGGDWVTYLLQGGPFAVVVLLVIFEKLVPPGERDRLRAENAQYREDIARLNQTIRDDIVPLLSQSNDAMKMVLDELNIHDHMRRQTRRDLE